MSEAFFIQGSEGKIQVFVDYPQGEVKGFAVVCHPHPLNRTGFVGEFFI